jgi:hypothetical protein
VSQDHVYLRILSIALEQEGTVEKISPSRQDWTLDTEGHNQEQSECEMRKLKSKYKNTDFSN